MRWAGLRGERRRSRGRATPGSRGAWSWTAARPPARPRGAGIVLHQTDTMMDGAEGRQRLARETLDFAATLA